MVTKRPQQRFKDILDSINDIQTFCRGVTLEEFSENREKSFAVQLACLRMSEAARKLGEIAEQVEPDIPWSDIRNIGSVIRHDYDEVRVDDIWNTVQNDLDPLKAACERALTHPKIIDSE